MTHQLPRSAGWDANERVPILGLTPEQQHRLAKPGIKRDLTDLKGCMLLTIKDVMHITGLGRTRIYEELAGPLKSVRVGRRRLIPAESLEEWRAGLQPSRPSAAA